MKIVEIIRDEKNRKIFTVKFQPNGIESLIGRKAYTEKFKEADYGYMFSQSGLYFRSDGTQLSNGHWIACAIDKFKNKW